ncbi:UvrB/UvrC motif-containing protein [Salinicoccus halitifaciens]|uniref:Protein arginine kinase activator n=1 Tax=Salinicoccus halitifaciens TaxID=1073415 RepID=A0ABV2EA18_9STAP|nr:UvrB/UvrC motif-containing protein [Salinicoccus halitifaciens]MCD2138289.1 UvrB/UvrC motif-containing protein [Salinicoccus halitifaciens]
MICESCQENEATVHITTGSGLNKTERYLCEVCANKSFSNQFANFPDDSFNIHQLLQSLSAQQPAGAGMKQKRHCDTCGSTIENILKNGKFGCADCYGTFSGKSNEIITRVQLYQTEHVGKVPAKSSAYLKVKKEIESLREKLAELVERQEFEEAAVVRDQIKSLEAGDGNGEG